MKLEYLSQIPFPYHFIGFSRFGRKNSKVDINEWNQTVLDVVNITFPAIREKVKELNISGRNICSCSATNEVLYTLDKTEVGIGLSKLSREAKGSNQKIHRSKLNKIYHFAFEKMAELAENSSHNLYLKLCKEGVLCPSIELSLKDICKIAVLKLPKKSIAKLPKPIQQEIALIPFLPSQFLG